MLLKNFFFLLLVSTLPINYASSHSLESDRYKHEIAFAEAVVAVNTICMHQQLGFYGAERAQEFTTPYLTNRVSFGELKTGDPLRIYKQLEKYGSLDVCPGVIDQSILGK